MSMHKVVVVCRPELANGFALAGVPTTEVANADEARRAIEALSSRPETGVLLVQEELLNDYRQESPHDQRPLPMIVPFPGPALRKGLSGAEAFITEILRQAIGYRVRLR
jgi:vacuolar-type H+-ATPase subunit F/Vma7